MIKKCSDLQKLFGDQKIIEELLKKEEKRIENEENKPTEKESIKTDEKSDDPVESQDEKSLEKTAEKPDTEKPDAEEEESSEPIEENITSKTVDDDSSVRQRKTKPEEASNDIELHVVETIGQTERQTNKDDNDAEQTVDLENKKTE